MALLNIVYSKCHHRYGSTVGASFSVYFISHIFENFIGAVLL